MKLRLGSLFSGYSGLDMGIKAAFASIGDVETVWVSDIAQHDKKGSRIGNAPAILAHRFPGVPNLGDITAVDWASVEPVDIIAGGSPCQDISTAGKLAGMTAGTRSNLWVEMREAIRVLQPAFVVWENVRGSLSASADSAVEPCPGCVGADGGGLFCEHLDVFSATWPASGSMRNGKVWPRPMSAHVTGASGSSSLLPTPSASLASNGGSQPPEKRRGGGIQCNSMMSSSPFPLLPTPRTTDRFGPGKHGDGGWTAVTLL